MGPYKQGFSRKTVSAGAGANDDGPGENPNPGGKEKFYLPRVLLYRDRYCAVCGQTIKEDWKFCRNPKCQASTVPQYPEVPPGWTRCPRCSLSYLHSGQHFSCICRLRTQAGLIWQTHATLLNRRIREMEELFRRGQWNPDAVSTSAPPNGQTMIPSTSAGTSGNSGTEVVAAGTSVHSSAGTSQSRKSADESFFDEDEGDDLVEKMLLDEEDEGEEEEASTAGVKVKKEGK